MRSGGATDLVLFEILSAVEAKAQGRQETPVPVLSLTFPSCKAM